MTQTRVYADRGEKRRQALLEAALRVIGRDGIRGVTHRSVSAEAQIALGATTYYFDSKEHLIEECLRYAADAEIAALEDAIGRIDPTAMSAPEWADSLVTWLGDEVAGPARARLIARYHLQLEAAARPELRDAYDAWTRSAFRLAERMLSAAGSANPQLDAVTLLAAVDGMRLNQLARTDKRAGPRSLRPGLERLMAQLLA